MGNVDLLYFLNRRLEFIQRFYESAAAPFAETARKISAGEEPYLHPSNPDDWDSEPPFLEEWQEADESIMVVGHWCLCMVQSSLNTYLRDSISSVGCYWWDSTVLSSLLGAKQGKSWFERYRLLFLEDLGIDWTTGPVSLADLEQLNLTRDDLIHNVDMMSFSVRRDEKHIKRFPSGLFTDELWRNLDADRVRIDKKQLAHASALVRDFCAWIDDIRCRYPQYREVVDAGQSWPSSAVTIDETERS